LQIVLNMSVTGLALLSEVINFLNSRHKKNKL